MKKKWTAWLLTIAALCALLGGCAPQKGEGAKAPETEPDTTTRTVTRSIGKHQTVVYRFHTEILASWDYSEVSLALFDREAESYDQAGTWCVARLGDTKNDHVFWAHQGRDTPKEEAWSNPLFDSEGKWSWFLAGKSTLGKEGEDMTLTFTRSGKRVKAVLEVEGKQTWTAQQTVVGMTNETVYFYLFTNNRSLTGIQFQDMGEAGRILPGWVRLLIIAVVVTAAYTLHRLAIKGEDKLFLIEKGCAPFTALYFVFAAVFTVFLLGRTHPEALTGWLTFPLPTNGPWFWAPVIVCGIGALGFTIFWGSQGCCGLKDVLSCVLGALFLGLLHTLWYGAVVIIGLSLLSEIFGLLVFIAFVVLLCLCASGMDKVRKNQVEVTTTTRVYNDIGNLVDFKMDVDYVDLPEKKK